MTIKTPQEYLQSLRDGRVVYCQGERVKDVTKHPLLRICANACAMDYAVGLDPQFRDTFVTKDEMGEETSFVFTPAKSADDLLRHREIIQILARTRLGEPGEAHNVATINNSRVTVARFRLTRYWVDFDWSGTENGLFDSPFSAFTDGLGAVPDGGMLVVKSGGSVSGGRILANPVKINSWNGSTIIGVTSR